MDDKKEGELFKEKLEKFLSEAFKDPALLKLVEVVSKIGKLIYRIEKKYCIEIDIPPDIEDDGIYVLDLLKGKLGDVPEVIEYENLEKEYTLKYLEYRESKGQKVVIH